ncbi:MAG: hypothetical protein M3373_04610 [Gemmatimonadota bacterium]|nr:hypothetical protein [Gemmatimonadota bacterium]
MALLLSGGYGAIIRARDPGAPEARYVVAGRAAAIAVLPFVNLSATDDEFFAAGMTEELINSLARVSGLRVAARTSVFALRGKELDVRTVGDTLGVTSVLEGSVRRAGNPLRVTARLVNTADRYRLWSDDFDREVADVFDVQNEIANAIVDELRPRLSPGRGGSVATGYATSDMEAYEEYLKGRFLLNMQGTSGTPRALEHFQRAVARDPNFARAYAGIASAQTRMGVLGRFRPEEEMPKAIVAADRALALDSTLAEAHTAVAHILMVWEWDEAVAWLERAYRERAPFIEAIDVISGLESVRGDPRFAVLRRKLGLAG